MSEMIAAWIGSMSLVYFVRQVIVIMLLFLLGLIITVSAYGKRAGIFEVLLSFPVGISVYSMASFLLLCLGIPFNTVTVTIVCLVSAIICMVFFIRQSGYNAIHWKLIIAGIITALCIGVISCSGLLPVSISNDSMYYYHMYPHALVHYGGLRMQFNVFLTDVGQSSAILNTLPFVYGFDEGFGVQAFLNINTLILIVYALYEESGRYMDEKKAKISAGMAAAALVCSMPYLIMSEWVMSNGLFMCFMFICMYTAYREADSSDSDDERCFILRSVIMGLLFTMMSLLRMEGCIVALILVVCFSTIKFTGRRLFMTFLLPILTVSIIYDARIFLFMKIYAPYTFLTPLKAVIQFAAIIAVSVYVLFIRDRLPDKLKDHMGIIILISIICVNAVLFLYDRALYIENAKAFVNNISNRSGWGLFPMFIIGVYVMCFIVSYKSGGFRLTFWDLCFFAYLLTAIAVSFARDDALRESIGDSGNRVMLQVTLLAFFAAAGHVISSVNDKIPEKTGNIKEV